MIGQYTGVPCSEKQALFFIKTFPFLRAWMLALLVSEWDFQFQAPSSRLSIVSSRSAFIFLAIVCFQSYCTLNIYINLLGAYLVLYP